MQADEAVVTVPPVVPEISDAPVEDDIFSAPGKLTDADIGAVFFPHPVEGAVAGHTDAPGVGPYHGVPQAQVLGQRPQENLAHIEKGLFRSVGAALTLTPDVAEVLTEQLMEPVHIVLLRFDRHILVPPRSWLF